jgi:hemolysin III
MEQNILRIKDPGSALTHFIAMIGTAVASVPLLVRASGAAPGAVRALGIFALSMFLLYTASTVYHTFDISAGANRLLRKIDHMMIYVLIAGSYTPVCAIVLGDASGFRLLAEVWIIAAAGILLNLFWIDCPKWLSSAIYIAMGWLCLTAIRAILARLTPGAFGWLLAGGLIYTAGGVIYALKLPIFNRNHPFFGSHEIFHLFVMGGSLCHFVMMYRYIA